MRIRKKKEVVDGFTILPVEFDQKSWHYKQQWRNENYAIYLKTKGSIRSFELIKIVRHNGYKIAGVEIHPAETYPPDREWGMLGFSCLSMEMVKKAAEKYFSLTINL